MGTSIWLSFFLCTYLQSQSNICLFRLFTLSHNRAHCRVISFLLLFTRVTYMSLYFLMIDM
ncbi:hypothetical protein C8J57DRAFT_1380064 [Mycena rebaudengoi]|nr:hypothetical protein C8J57DRAFT_1380064 [Mycena rebaudengoi]